MAAQAAAQGVFRRMLAGQGTRVLWVRACLPSSCFLSNDFRFYGHKTARGQPHVITRMANHKVQPQKRDPSAGKPRNGGRSSCEPSSCRQWANETWQDEDLELRRKGGEVKVELALRSRRETTMGYQYDNILTDPFPLSELSLEERKRILGLQ